MHLIWQSYSCRMATASSDTTRDLQERFGGVYDLGALAQFCGVTTRTLRQSLERAGVPVLNVGRKQAVVRELAERALGLDRADVALEMARNEDAMRRLEWRADGSRRSVAEFASSSSERARAALEAFGASGTR
jgi:hypothetical protein